MSALPSAGVIVHRHGAWLVSIYDPDGDATPEQLYDCASSAVVAKRLAVRMARQLGYLDPHRWTFDAGDARTAPIWTLRMAWRPANAHDEQDT